MAEIFGKSGPRFPTLGTLVKTFLYKTLSYLGSRRLFFNESSDYASLKARDFQRRMNANETLYLIGCGLGGHNSGMSLLRCSRKQGIEILANNEEERFSGVKHCTEFPSFAIAELRTQMKQLGIEFGDIHTFLGTWDYPAIMALSLGDLCAEAPFSWAWLTPSLQKGVDDPKPMFRALFFGARLLQKAFEADAPVPVIGVSHHDAHADYSYASSPFCKEKQDCMIAVIDGNGGTGSISLYTVIDKKIVLRSDNDSFFDSLGHLYSVISATQGGWTPLSSEGRYMGAAAWGDSSRLTNPYYKSLRQIFYFTPNGELKLNRKLANWHLKGFVEPYSEELKSILGEPISLESMWNPDAILKAETIEHSPQTIERFDKAAALQLVFEDGLFHVIGNFIKQTGLQHLILSGGCALNCVANMRLLEQFNHEFYHHHLGKKDHFLRLWIPPAPGDAGVSLGSAISFARKAGMLEMLGERHGFYCGRGPSAASIMEAKQQEPQIAWIDIKSLGEKTKQHDDLADIMAFLISEHLVIGIVQGSAETGPRALGQRSILANPCTSETIATLNAKVKFRERVRPLAPMMTLEAAQKYYHLEAGAMSEGCTSYDYMVLAVKARSTAKQVIPAVIHHDGTSRIQIVHKELSPITHAFLKAMGRHIGVEVAVNTSLNVASPIVQSPLQALQALRRSHGLDAVFFLDDLGDVSIAYDTTVDQVKDGGQRLRQLISNWKTTTACDKGPTSGDRRT